MGGAIGRVAEDATAFAGRAAAFDLSADSAWDDPALDDANRAWVRRAMAVVEPDSTLGRYANENADVGPEQTRLLYGDAKLARLAQLKRDLGPGQRVPPEPQRGAGLNIEASAARARRRRDQDWPERASMAGWSRQTPPWSPTSRPRSATRRRSTETSLAYIEYVVKHGRLALIHTEVLPEYEGQGVGSGLVRFAIAEARRRGLLVIPTCPFVRVVRRVAPGDARHRHRDAARSAVGDKIGSHRAEAFDVDVARLERPPVVEERRGRRRHLDAAGHT